MAGNPLESIVETRRVKNTGIHMSPWRGIAPLAAIAFFVGASASASLATAELVELAASGTATSARAQSIQKAIDELASWARAHGGVVSASVVEIETGAVLAEHDAHAPLNPASNMKVVTAAVALDLLGPAYRFKTELHGRILGGRVVPLVIRGFGDPSFTTAKLWTLAHALSARGVREVDRVLVDQTWFDDQFVPPGFEQQPNEWAPFRAPVSALALDGNSVALNVLPGSAGDPARIWFDPPGFVTSKGSVTTGPARTTENVRLTMSPAGMGLVAQVGGAVPEGAGRLRFFRRTEDPRLMGGQVLVELLKREGVTVTGDVALGGEGVGDRITFLESEPLGVLVRELGKQSDNFYAEMLFKTLGAEAGRPATSARSASVVSSWLSASGSMDPGTQILNGSGLFDGNRLSARALTTVLRRAHQSAKIGPDFVAHLAIGGVDGTLRSRLRTRQSDHAVRAKTGTLAKAAALSGYVLPPPGGSPLAFSILVNGANAPHATSRARIDAVVNAVVAHVWGPKASRKAGEAGEEHPGSPGPAR